MGPMAQGKKSEATKRREAMHAAGILPRPMKDAARSAGGRIGAMRRHGPAFLGRLPTVQEVRRESTERAVRDAVRGDAVDCARFLADLALGRNGFEEAPIRERRQAAGMVLGVSGVRLTPTAEDHGADEKPLNEMSPEELAASVRAIQLAIAARSAEDAEPVGNAPPPDA